MKLIGYKKITGKIKLLSGLHIGGSEEASRIGAIDNPVIRLQKNNYPYIPGSSLKGKLRSLLELYKGYSDGGRVCSCGKCEVCILFGVSASDKNPDASMGRLVFSDCYIDESDNTVKRILKQSKGNPFSEEKTEVVIDRFMGSAKKGGLRKIERVPAGVVFDFNIQMRVFDIDDDVDKLEQTIKEGIGLLENDALGGSGSRGYGRVEITDYKIEDVNISSAKE